VDRRTAPRFDPIAGIIFAGLFGLPLLLHFWARLTLA
jgi:hypothetical protein